MPVVRHAIVIVIIVARVSVFVCDYAYVCEAHISQVIPNVLAFFRLLFNTGKCVCTIPINNNNNISSSNGTRNRNCLTMANVDDNDDTTCLQFYRISFHDV